MEFSLQRHQGLLPTLMWTEGQEDTFGEKAMQTICISHGVPLFHEDLVALNDGGWVTDNIVAVYMRMLQSRNNFPTSIVLMDSIFYLSLTQGGNEVQLKFWCASTHFNGISCMTDTVIFPICIHCCWYSVVI